jgi:hypothetical protein
MMMMTILGLFFSLLLVVHHYLFIMHTGLVRRGRLDHSIVHVNEKL